MSDKVKLAKVLIAITLLLVTVIAHELKPTIRLADTLQPLVLDNILPMQFANWQQLQINGAEVVNPEVDEIITKIYQQVISRAYVDSHNNVILVSVAYGENQMSDSSLHRPEICYPAQGFKINQAPLYDTINVNHHLIRVKRLFAEKGLRKEPITYWTMIGNKNVRGVYESKVEISKYALKGFIPDGLIFRVSMISEHSNAAFKVQDNFIRSLLKSIPAKDANRISGI